MEEKVEEKVEGKVEQTTVKKKNNKNVILIILGMVAIIVAIVAIEYFNNPVTKFKHNLDNADVSELQEIYQTTESYDEKKSIEKIFKDKLEGIVDEFINGTKGYETAIEEIDRYKEINEFYDEIKSAKEDIEKVKASKDKFGEGQSYENEGKILEAIKSYGEVIELDENNYKVAQDYIKNNKEKLKKETLTEVDTLIANNDYITANQKINELKEVISNDDAITQKSNEIKDKAKQQEIEKYKNEQQVTVERTGILVQHDEYKSLYPDMIEVVIKNNTSKTIKDYNLAILAYDSNNYPLKIKPKYDYRGGAFEFTGQAENVNIVAGATGGKDYGWELDSDHGISKVLAIVKEVTYYDGTTWENPYYTYWIEQYKEKPLQ